MKRPSSRLLGLQLDEGLDEVSGLQINPESERIASPKKRRCKAVVASGGCEVPAETQIVVVGEKMYFCAHHAALLMTGGPVRVEDID